MEELLELLQEILPNVDWEEDNLVDDGVLSSIEIITIISEITDEYDVKITTDEMKPENFNSAKAIYDMIQTLQED